MLHHCRERAVDVARASGGQGHELHPDGARRLLQLRRLSRRFRIVRIDQEGDACRIGGHLVQQSQPLGSEFGVEPAHPGDIAARLPDTGDKAALDRVVAAREHDRDRAGRLHGDERRIVAAGCGDHGHLAPDQFGRERRQPIVLVPPPSGIRSRRSDPRRSRSRSGLGGTRQSPERTPAPFAIEEADHRHRRLLRARAASGHAAAAPPSSVMNSRRLMSNMGPPPRCLRRSYQLEPPGRRRSDASGACRGKGRPVLGVRQISTSGPSTFRRCASSA